MAESVDALVSNTSGATHPGSSPGLGLVSNTSGATHPGSSPGLGTKANSEPPAGTCLQGVI